MAWYEWNIILIYFAYGFYRNSKLCAYLEGFGEQEYLSWFNIHLVAQFAHFN